nr:SprT family zinc-dependent metalloprotease [Ramlibacter aurantiacus]
MALDLFEDDPPPAERIDKPPRPAPPVPAAAPALPIASVLQPAVFRHPKADRHTVLGEVRVAYELRRARRRHIGFLVGPEGLTVSAPRWVPLYEIEAALQKKAGWIVRKLVEMRDRDQRREAGRIEWRDGASLPFLGEPVRIVLDARASSLAPGGLLRPAAGATAGPPDLQLHLALPQQAEPGQIRDAVQAWLMRQATRVFNERLAHFAPLLGVRWSKLTLSSASTRWGSAHSNGSIRLNWRLIHFRLPIIDYVVAHELSHLRVMDHSPRFWETVGSVVPDYAHLRSQLRADPLPPW